MLKKIITCCFLFVYTLHGFSQIPIEQQVDLAYFLPQGSFTYLADIPTPKQFFGFELGEQCLNNAQVVAYLHLLAQKSSRLTIETVGYTYEKRPLVFLTVCSPENHMNLENIRTERLKISQPALSHTCDTQNMPIVVWLCYSIHGNEVSGVNASVAVAYFLAAAEGPEIDDILKNSVIMIHPAQNPDGLERFATWVNTNRSFTLVTDPNSREFREPQPSGRTNHYWFDLNRDWLLLQMPESQARMDFYYRWRPTMVNDYHEQGTSNNYYFSPGSIKQTHNLIPSSNWEVTRQISWYHAEALNKIGGLYYSKENYDDFYPGKGGCLPDFHGAIGILYEQPSSRGFFQERTDGSILSFVSTIRNQTYCSISAIRAAIDMRVQLLNYTRDSYIEAQKMAKADAVQGYVFGSPQTRQLDNEFFNILKRHQIEVYQLNKTIKQNERTFEKEYAYVVPSQQNDYRLLKAIMEKKTDFLDSTFYDISAWTLPLAFNLHYAELNNIKDLTGERLIEFPPVTGMVRGKSDYAYLFNVHEFLSVKLIYELQEAGLRLKTASKPFSIQVDGKEQTFDYGAVMLSVEGQIHTSDRIHALLETWASKTGVTVYPVSSGLAVDYDLGGSNFRNMVQPEVAVIYGSGVNFSGAGEAWHLFDQRLQIPLTLLEANRITAQTLARYNTIILSGNISISDEISNQLKTWHQNGGRFIAIGESWRTINKIGVATIELNSTASNDNSSGKAPEYLPYTDRLIARRVRIPGAILACRLDRSSPVAYGIIENTIPTFRESVSFFKSPTPYSCPVSYLDEPLLSGCIAPDLLKQIAGAPATLTFPRLVYFADEPVYRAYWFGTTRLFLNAIFFPM